MKEIILASGDVTQVSDEDYDFLSLLNWFLSGGRGGYAATWIDGKQYKMASIILWRQEIKTPVGTEVDHIDRNKLNNQRENLRVVTHNENQRNKGLQSNNTTGYKGVHFCRTRQKWSAMIKVRRVLYNLGYFDTLEEAVAVRLKAEEHYLKPRNKT